MFTLHKAIYRFSAIPIKIPMPFFFFTEIEKTIINPREPLRTQIAKTIWRMINKAGGITLPDFKIYYKITVWYWHIKTVSYLHKDGHINQRYRIESSEINPHMHNQLIFDKGTENT